MISSTPAPAQNKTGVALDVSISGLRNAKGNILACMTEKPAFFLKCDKDPQSHKLRIAVGQAATLHFADVTPGTYAIAFIHDENANNKMDMALFLPKEGFGFSRNPKMGMGPPKFASAAFTIGAVDTKLAVVMKYML